MRPSVAALMVLASALLARSAAAADAPAFSAVSDRYFGQEDLWNGIYVGVGAANIAGGVALATRQDTGLRAAGYPAIVFGGVQLVVGVVYLAITPGFRADARAALAKGPGEAVRSERARMRKVEAGFKYYKTVEGTIGLTGLVLGVVGAARRSEAMMGAGVGLGVSACFQLVLEHSTHDVAKAYLRALDGISVTAGGPSRGVGITMGGAMPW
jgi:hypothetical protein